MCARKYGSDAFGAWDRDENSLPCYDLDVTRVPRLYPPLRHVLGTGRVCLLADQYGVMQLFAAIAGQFVCFNAPRTYPQSILSLAITSEGHTNTFLPHAMDASQRPLMRWGVGYVCYEGDLRFAEDKGVRVCLRVRAPVDTSFMLAHIRLENTAKQSLPVDMALRANIAPAPARYVDPPRHAFVKDAAAAFTDLHPQLGDFFLAGSSSDEWKADAQGAHLQLRKAMVLKPGSPFEATVLFGCSSEFSVAWVNAELEKRAPEADGAAWRDWLNREKIRAPELWMQEECVWSAGRLLAFRCMSGRMPTDPIIASPGGATVFMTGLWAEAVPPSVSVRELLLLSLPLTHRTPELALANLMACCRAQGGNGRLGKDLHGPIESVVDAGRDRSDLEIWLLLAWAEYMTSHPDCTALDERCPFLDGEQATVWDHLKQAYIWVRDELREGPHGLLRMLAGDANPYLNKVGGGGKGESVLNTAMACYAAQRLADIARRREDHAFAEEMTAWLRKLRIAVGESFDGPCFRRAYTDAGRPLGSRVEGRMFADVQAWAVLAKCGTADQRQMALTHLLEARGKGPAGICLTKPFPTPPPADVSDSPVPPGEAENGGFCLPTIAWVVWALAAEGFIEEAVREWHHLSIRCRAEQAEDLSAALLMNLPHVPSRHAGRRNGACGLREAFDSAWLPQAHAVAWQEFALRKITAKS